MLSVDKDFPKEGAGLVSSALADLMSIPVVEEPFPQTLPEHQRPEAAVLVWSVPISVYRFTEVTDSIYGLLNSVELLAWRYIATRDAQIVATADVRNGGGGIPVVSQIDETEEAGGLEPILRNLLAQRTDLDARMRLLEQPAVPFSALWLHSLREGSDDDLFYEYRRPRFAPGPPGESVPAVLTAADVAQRLLAIHHRRAEGLPPMRGDRRATLGA